MKEKTLLQGARLIGQHGVRMRKLKMQHKSDCVCEGIRQEAQWRCKTKKHDILVHRVTSKLKIHDKDNEKQVRVGVEVWSYKTKWKDKMQDKVNKEEAVTSKKRCNIRCKTFQVMAIGFMLGLVWQVQDMHVRMLKLKMQVVSGCVEVELVSAKAG